MVHEYVYTLGLAGNRTKVEEFRYDEGSSRPALSERTMRYIYDDLYRLVHEIVTVKNSAGTGTQWQRTDTFTYDKVGNRKTMQRKTINQQTDVLYDYNATDQLLSETATTLQREAGGGYAAAPRPTRFAGVALGSITALAFACLLAPFALLRTSGQGRKARRNRRFVACVSAFFVPLMAIDPSHVYALHEEAMAYQALAAAGLATVDPNTQLTTYDYDANGNMVEKVVDNPSTGIKTTLYTYDAENRLATVDDGSGVGGVVSYTYDADGIRTSKLVGVTLTTYVVDKNRPYAQVLEERQEVGGVSTVVKRYVYGHDLISQTDSPGDGQYASTSYFHYDGQMSTRALSQGATVIADPTPLPLGSVIAEYSYDAFGSSLDLEGNPLPAGSTSATDYLYTGEQHDANAGFYYLRARYYSPGVGRFITRDTYQGSKHDPGSLHKYLYANANPVDNFDPSGAFAIGTLGAVAIGAIIVNVGATVYNGVRKNLSAKIVAWQALTNIAFFALIAVSAFGGGVLAAFAGIALIAFSLVGLLSLIRSWPDMDTTDKIVSVVQVATFIAFAGALSGGAFRGPSVGETRVGDACVLPESYFGRPVIDMAPASPRGGRTISNWPRNYEYFWREVYRKHPEFFDEANVGRINPSDGESFAAPKVNERWIQYHPAHAAFKGETLVHHHLGQGRYAVALPNSVHLRFSAILHPY